MSRSPRWRPAALQLKPLYRADDLQGLAHLDSLPGQAPFVRGPYASMYTQKPWTIRQYTGFAHAQATNQRLRQSLAEGAQGLSVAFDLPTHRGYDSSDAAGYADVGKAGVAIDSVEDMHELFAGIALDRVSVSMTMNGAVLPVLAAYIVAAEERGIPAERLGGTIQNDILKEFMVRNTYIFAPTPSLRILTDVVAYVTRHMPRFNPISVSGYHFQEAGADAVLELALTLVNARTYAECVRARGLDLEAFCARMSFFFGIGSDFYLEIAKLRAARLLWCEIATELGLRSDRAKALRMHCQTSGWSLSAQGARNNIVRTTVEAMAAVFGGTQSLHTNAWDEALGLPSEASARLACSTQQILQQESGLCDVIDPWAGSYLMESLTARLADEVRRTLAEIDAQGGVLAALESGWITQRIHASAVRTQARIDSGIQPLVGLNTLTQAAETAEFDQPVDSQALRARQTRRLAQLHARRDAATVMASLTALTHCAQSGRGNLLEATIAAIRARATLGECTAALEKVWPRYRQPLRFQPGPYGEQRRNEPRWLAMRERLRHVARQQGGAPRLLLAKLGQDGHDRGVRILAAGLADAGFDIRLGPLFQSPGQLLALVQREEVDLLGLSSLAGAHGELVPMVLRGLQEKGLRTPVVIGGVIPEADVRRLLAAGVQAHFGPGSDLLEIAERLLDIVCRTRPEACSLQAVCQEG